MALARTLDRTRERELRVGLDVPLPAELAVGRGTAVFVCGWCFAHERELRSLDLVVDGEPQPAMAFGMPRLDLFRDLHPGIDPFASSGMTVDPAAPDDPSLRSYRGGFWGIARISARGTGGPDIKLSLRAELDTGAQATAPLATIGVAGHDPPPPSSLPPDPGEGPLVAICMATFNPPADLVARQIASIRAQTHRNWLCIVSDDCSTAESLAVLRRAIGDDERFIVSRSPRRLGFYRNFERALSMAPAAAEFVAMADQDDQWYPEKLATLLERIGDAELIYSDARIVARDGSVISDTYWIRRRNNHTSMLSLLVANSVTGAASLLRREVLEFALPFPPAQFSHYHDHWLALTALALGEIRFVERPLYDYLQHGSAWLGHATANRMPTLRDRFGSLRTRSPRDRVRKWRMHYFVDIARLIQFATVLEMRCGERMAAGKRRDLETVLESDASLVAPARFALRGIRELVGRPETLGAEWMLFAALLWRRLLTLSTRDRPQRRLRLDAVPPPDLAPGPGHHPGFAATAVSAIAEKIAPLAFRPDEDGPMRVNLLIPTVDLEHLFAGYIGKFNLARRLAERGARVRIVTVDPTPPLPRNWARRLESYEGLERLTERVEIVFGRESPAIEASRSDAFIATTWWTAHIARRALSDLGGERFLYLIQEYEPFTFPMGTYAALSRESYEMPHVALFSSELLRDWFRQQRIGVYAGGSSEGDALSAVFENAISPVAAPSVAELSGRLPRRLLFYARPEPHAARNMFELGMLALSRALEQGAFQRGWELRGIGTLAPGRRLALSGGARLELLPRADQREYARLLPEHDLGLALMYTPHPSLVPIEMAAAGMLAVTNSFANKTPEALKAISSNLVVAPPTIDGVANALREAALAVEDAERRVRGSHVRWSRDWDTSLGNQLLADVETLLGLGAGATVAEVPAAPAGESGTRQRRNP
jgi:glycosyltransferase involved in cell wall biosynthesis